MTSPPQTPSADAPKRRKDYRFKETGYPTEWEEDYRPGGYHPVHIDDSFKNGRYRVIRKLGEGSFSTVWLTVDLIESTYAALKIMSAKASSSSGNELSIYGYLSKSAHNEPLSTHLVMLLDSFEHTGPNGVHTCLVFEPMGPSAASMVDELACNKPKMYGKRSRYPKTMAKTILRHALEGLAFLHKKGIVHGDVQPGNMLFALSDLNSLTEDRLRQDIKRCSKRLRRRDGKIDLWGPKYLALGQSLIESVDLAGSMTVKLSDLGCAFWERSPPETTVTPLALRAPEIIFKDGFGPGIDIWAIGVLIYELITGTQLFAVTQMDDDDPDETDDLHILDFIDVLQPLPNYLISKWTRKEKWIGPNGERLQPQIDDAEDLSIDEDADASITEDESDGDETGDNSDEDLGERSLESDRFMHKEHYDTAAGFHGSGDSALADNEGDDNIAEAGEGDDFQGPIWSAQLETQFEKNKPSDIDAEEARIITTLIREVLQYDALKRPTAQQLLNHPWLRE